MNIDPDVKRVLKVFMWIAVFAFVVRAGIAALGVWWIIASIMAFVAGVVGFGVLWLVLGILALFFAVGFNVRASLR